jgi:hypothetical protein
VLRVALGVALGAALVACNTLPDRVNEPSPTPVVDRIAVQGASVASLLDTLQRLVRGGPAEQAEVFSGIKRDYDEAPTPSHELRYALALSTPGHAGADPAAAQRLLRELVATPEALLPAERALAFLEAQRVDRQVQLAAENQRLRAEADRADHERTASSGRRLQAEIDENAHLRKQLEDAQAKLDAIANIERTINERKSPNEGR